MNPFTGLFQSFSWILNGYVQALVYSELLLSVKILVVQKQPLEIMVKS